MKLGAIDTGSRRRGGKLRSTSSTLRYNNDKYFYPIGRIWSFAFVVRALQELPCFAYRGSADAGTVKKNPFCKTAEAPYVIHR
ncbi:hypothetical protein [Microcoleus sp. bin38.metabat.b11b12b14.051]|uniref:hypothetical protein n=1 Tax=Microcoleus sp. bin38.metabat.b11b12b14.051 TaxID=2742709 RepID=UPI0025DC4B19|nr:hypothetical protein [Microcoleus sp. bin38.metabat.b11b12b14.051]